MSGSIPSLSTNGERLPPRPCSVSQLVIGGQLFGALFVNLLGTNLPIRSSLFNDMTSALAKDRALRSVA